MRTLAELTALIRRWLVRDRTARKRPIGSERPAWLVEAERLQGIREIPGSESSPDIMAWAARQAPWIRAIYTADEVPWCGLFAAHCVSTAGLPLPKNPLSALAWADWGIPLRRPSLGAVAVFRRAGGGHVGFIVAESPEGDLHVLGGNQSDRVSTARFSRERLVGMRWPEGVPTVRTALPVLERGVALSTKEA